MSKQVAKAIRTNLKSLGLNSKKVSVRSKSYAGGSSVHVTVKDLSVDLPTVKRIASAEAVVRRCAYSGEILGGGTFVFVESDHGIEETLAAVIKADWASGSPVALGAYVLVNMRNGDLGVAEAREEGAGEIFTSVDDFYSDPEQILALRAARNAIHTGLLTGGAA